MKAMYICPPTDLPPSPVEKQAAETLEPLALVEQKQTDMSCSLDNPEDCEACGS